MGLSYEEVTKINKKIIYASISGFGDKGPYSSQRVHEPSYTSYLAWQRQ